MPKRDEKKTDKKTEKKEKKEKAKKKKSEFYKISQQGIERKKFCPKCGAGVFLAEHKNRHSCGNCSYTEWK